MELMKTTFAMASDIVSRKNQDGTCVLMRMDDSEVFYKIDGIAAEVFSLIDGKKTVGAITEEILQTKNFPKEKVCADIDAFLSKLIAMKVIVKA